MQVEVILEEDGSIIIPAAMCEELSLEAGQKIHVSSDSGSIKITKVRIEPETEVQSGN